MNAMTRPIRQVAAVLLLVLGAAVTLQPLPVRAAYSQAELDQLLAPVALYPDALLSQVLAAATRPLEVVEAARWSRANPGLQGDEAVRAAQFKDWDPSVKSLVAFPQLLARMDEDLEWTKALGHAFFTQEPVVMETIQALRRRAREAGQLLPDDRQSIVDDGQSILIQPATPQVVYVPYYDPWIVYGTWWWPANPPVYWRPWPGYTYVTRPGYRAAFWWGTGVGVSPHLFFGTMDWPRRRAYYGAPVHPAYARPPARHREPGPLPQAAPAPRPSPPPRFEPRPAYDTQRSQPLQRVAPTDTQREPRRARAPVPQPLTVPQVTAVPPSVSPAVVPQSVPQPATAPILAPQRQQLERHRPSRDPAVPHDAQRSMPGVRPQAAPGAAPPRPERSAPAVNVAPAAAPAPRAAPPAPAAPPARAERPAHAAPAAAPAPAARPDHPAPAPRAPAARREAAESRDVPPRGARP